MANTKEIRAKIVSTKKTQQTTKAMKMVSAVKLRKSQDKIVNARPYAHRIRSVIKKVAETQKIEHPLLSVSESDDKVLLVVLTSDRGLCGGFNNNIIKYARTYYQENKSKHEKMDFLFIGRRGSDFFKNQLGVMGVDTILNLVNDVNYSLAAVISEKLLEHYLTGEYSEIRIIYNEFKSAMSQDVVDERLLPIAKHTPDDEEESLLDASHSKEFIFEPQAEEILEELLMKHFNIQVYRCMLESVASEHGSRMTAMENATKNAGEQIDHLTLTYNKIRQAAITTELIEITSGAEALNN